MLALIIVSSTLVGASVSIGFRIAKTIGLSFEEKSEDLFVDFWLGLSFILVISVATVACVPLKTIAAVTIILFVILAMDGLRRICFSGGLATIDVFVAAPLVLLVALAASQPSQFYDSGLYHYQIMEWYRSYGAVPGIALLHHRLGFTSSLFALEAIAEWPPLKGIGNVVNASCLIVSLWFAANRLCLTNRYSTGPSVLYWPTCMIVGLPMFGLVLFSTSPDVLVCLFVAVLGWLAVKYEHLSEMARSWRPAAFVVMAAGAYSVKASGLAVVAVCLLVTIHIYRMQWARIIALAGLSIILVLPVWIVNAVTSGYPLFPLLGFRLPFSWALSPKTANTVSDSIVNFPFVYQSQHMPPATLGAKLTHLFWVDPTLLSLGVLNVLGFTFLGWVYGVRPKAWPISIVIVGLLMLVGIGLAIRVPATRFVLGYLIVMPAFALAHLKERWLLATFVVCFFVLLFEPWQYFNRLDIVRVSVFGLMILLLTAVPKRSAMFSVFAVLCLCLFQYMRPLMSSMQYALSGMREPYRLLVPPDPRSLAFGEFVWVKRGEVSTREPTGGSDQCWATEPPCAPADANLGTVKNLRYRETGAIGGGFVQSE